ncbi:MAG TPA: shikimate dehydrogenase, partial [Blastocatellia bacterium]|nr:shikimate dehydrogenase [Blastocatellia bacterium]
NFDETPGNLAAVYESISRMTAAVYKIATRARSITDSLAHFSLLERARRDGRDLIAVAMGYPGLVTRVLGPSRGSFLTYCAVESGCESAAGQTSCEELNEIFRLPEISRDTLVAAVIGDPVSHSASPEMHNAAARALGLDFVYLPLEVADLARFFERFVRPASRELDWRLRGLSVTIPHKQKVLEQLDAVDGTASRVSAANTVVIEGGEIKGYNTDLDGAIRPLEAACAIEGIALSRTSCAVIGAGGAARAVVYGLIKRGARVSVYARDPEKAAQLAVGLQLPVHSIDRLGEHDREIIINTTPVGMRGHSEGSSVAPHAAFTACRVAYDLVYNPLETEFLRLARLAGCHTVSGLEMLVAQAALQFELWTGRRPPEGVMREAALRKLGAPKS